MAGKTKRVLNGGSDIKSLDASLFFLIYCQKWPEKRIEITLKSELSI